MLHLNGLQSEEDIALKQQLELYVERAQDSEEGIQRAALESMRYTRLDGACTFLYAISTYLPIKSVKLHDLRKEGWVQFSS